MKESIFLYFTIISKVNLSLKVFSEKKNRFHIDFDASLSIFSFLSYPFIVLNVYEVVFILFMINCIVMEFYARYKKS